MKKINFKVLIITCMACLLPMMIGMYFYESLPESIAIHWGIDNNPNGYFSKAAFVFGMPLIMILLQVICCIASDLSDKNPEANRKTVMIAKWIIPTLTTALYIVTIMYALGCNLDIRRIVMIILGILFIVLGNYIPKTKGAMVLGVKRFVMKNSDLENKISRISGYMLVLDGILFLISIAFNSIVSVVLVGLAIVEGLIIYIYALKENRK